MFSVHIIKDNEKVVTDNICFSEKSHHNTEYLIFTTNVIRAIYSRVDKSV